MWPTNRRELTDFAERISSKTVNQTIDIARIIIITAEHSG
jgi:hypothetical protein